MIPYIVMSILAICLLVNVGVLKFKTKKSREIYDLVIAHRGLHINAPENTLKAYDEAIKRGLSIEIDIRNLPDDKIICFHDRYTKRLLGFPGKVQSMSYEEIKKYRVLSSEERVPLLDEVLKLVDGQIPILVEVKGSFDKEFREAFIKATENYRGVLYFHVKNVVAYHRLKKLYGKRVFYILNPFRRRFEFIKGKHYKRLVIPKLDDLILTVETTDTAKSVISKLWKVSNRYETRTRKNHWLFNTPIAHRGICTSDIPENSIDSFLECVKKGVGIEADFVYYKGEVRCYHSDKASTRFGQPVSCAEKIPIEKSITLKEFLKAVEGKVPVIFDIKDAHFANRRLEKLLMEELKSYSGEYVVQSFNPRVVSWFERKYPHIRRGQVGHSLRGLRNKIPNPVLIAVNFCLFYTGKPDYIMYDLDKNVHILPTFNNIVGLPVLGYAPKSVKETYEFQDFFANFVYEDLENREAWGEYFKENFNKEI